MRSYPVTEPSILQNQEETSSPRPTPASFGSPKGDRGHGLAYDPCNPFWGHMSQPVRETTVQEVEQQSTPVSDTSNYTFEDCISAYDNVYGGGDSYDNVYGGEGSHDNVYGGGDSYDNVYDSYDNVSGGDNGFPEDRDNSRDDLWAVADLDGEAPHFCRVGRCLYWHTELKQVKRHRDTHFGDRYGWLCPNQTDSCKSQGADFRRRDAVNAHCRSRPECLEVLKANGGKIEYWGTPANDQDLVRYDPGGLHIPYRISDGRGRR